MNKPKAYQQGWIEFYKLRFKVTEDVLIPRSETELLVDEVLNFVKDSHVANTPQNNNNVTLSETRQSYTILDLGTGSGAIAIALACNLEGYNVRIIASDVSQEALKIAEQNAKLHGVEDKIIFIQSNLLSAFFYPKISACHPGGGQLKTSKLQDNNNAYSNTAQYRSKIIPDIIVTNLPYIPSTRIPYLDSSVKDFEPIVALNGGEDGFELYRKLFAQIVKKNWQPKLIVGEIDYTHGKLAINEAQKYFPNLIVEIKNDLAHKQRILIIKSTNN